MAKKYIDAEKLERHFENCICEAYNTNGVTEDFEIALKATKNQPVADVQEVVRCKDCNYYDIQNCYCEMFDFDTPSDDFYCREGERMDGDKR